MTISIEKESFGPDVFTEVLPLAQKCWNESTTSKADTCAYYGERDFDVEPDIDSYQRLADRGLLVLVTLRDEATLKGYLVGFLHHSMHRRKILCGFGDSMYVESDYRSYTGAIVERFEKELRNLGAQVIGWPVDRNGPVFKVLEAMGYVGDDIVMEKRLCA